MCSLSSASPSQSLSLSSGLVLQFRPQLSLIRRKSEAKRENEHGREKFGRSVDCRVAAT